MLLNVMAPSRAGSLPHLFMVCWRLAKTPCGSKTKVVWNLPRSRIEWIPFQLNLCCEDKNNERQHLPLYTKQPALQGAGEQEGAIRLDSFGDHAWALLRIHPFDRLWAASAGDENQSRV